ncbi:MAG: BatD family protein [Flavisolibacter sp.]
MKLTTLFLIFSLRLFAQKVETIAPTQPIITGTAFLVQYVITEPSLLVNIISPEFEGLQVVSGPNYYKGDAVVDGRIQPIENITYTLVASKNGSVKIPGLTAVFKNGLKFSSMAESIEVILPPQASYLSSSAYTDISLYKTTGKTDIDKLIDENIFIRTDISKKHVFIGEPVVATFTLYSRLQAVSEVVNTPSLYGFRAIDMLNINRPYQSVKTIGNKIFNTSVIRKLQLYPEQSGRLVIDEMQIRNQIEFDNPILSNKKKLEKILNSSPISITVKELPVNKPQNFSGAVGNFTIEASLGENKLFINQQGRLVIRIKGKGNFTQFTIPQLVWPNGFDVFEPQINEQQDKTIVPMVGFTEYIFNFVHDSTGNYRIPPVAFSFFDPVSGKYKMIQTDSINLEILPSVSGSASNVGNKIKSRNRLIWILIPLVLLTSVLLYFKRKTIFAKSVVQTNNGNQSAIINQVIDLDVGKLSDKQACQELQKLTRRIYQERSLNPAQKTELQSIEKDCQLLAYSDISESFDREELKRRLIRVLLS